MRRNVVVSLVLSVVFAVALTACGGGSTNSGSNTNNATTTGSCQLSGGLTSTITCSSLGLSGTTNGVTSNVFTLADSSNGGDTIAILIDFNSQLATGTYTLSSASVRSGTALVGDTSSHLWAASTTNPGSSMTLDITSLSAATSSASGNYYLPHGTLTATLVPVYGNTASSNVTLSATF